MKGFERAEIREAILGAYSKRTFDRLLLDRFDIRREVIAGDGPFRDVVDDVLAHFIEAGREAYLLAEVAADRPLRSEIDALYRKYAEALLSDGWRSGIEARMSDQLERYGLLPVPELQSGGRRLVPRSHGDAHAPAFGGFQKQIRAALPELDVLQWSSLLMRQTCRVCRVEVNGIPMGSGFLVGPAVVLTSYHVVSEAIRARLGGAELTFLFDYWKKPNGVETAGTRVEARDGWEDWHVDSSPPLGETQEHAGTPEPTGDQLDHAMIMLKWPLGDAPVVPGGPKRGWIGVHATAPTLVTGMAIAILHHPRTGPIKLTFDTRALQRVNGGRTRLRYATNTDGGSSGAPCFGVNLELLGMHHFSDLERAAPTYNQGIPIEAVYKRLGRVGKLGVLGGESP